MLNDLRDVLQKIDNKVFYGLAPRQIKNEWNYIVFRRNVMKKNNSTSFTDYYVVAIVRENFVPSGLEFNVINEIEKNTMLRLADKDAQYEYIYKKDTDLVCEVLMLEFYKSKKRCE